MTASAACGLVIVIIEKGCGRAACRFWRTEKSVLTAHFLWSSLPTVTIVRKVERKQINILGRRSCIVKIDQPETCLEFPFGILDDKPKLAHAAYKLSHQPCLP